MRRTTRIPLRAGLLVLAIATVASAQTTRPATKPAVPEGAEAVSAVAVKVSGSVRAAPVAEAGQAVEWRPVREGDRLGSSTQIRTGLRSSLLLQFGDSTIVKIDRVTSATIAQFYRTTQAQRVRLDLGYGAVRAGVAEGAVESDMVIETPVATVTRRGTWDFEIEYEAVTHRFRITGPEQGLIDALNQLTNQRQSLTSDEFVTEKMIRWIDSAKFVRQIRIFDAFGLDDSDNAFCLRKDSGMSVVVPGGGYTIFNAAGRYDSRGPTPAAVSEGPTGGLTGTRDRPEGNFGTGGGTIPNPTTSDNVRSTGRGR